MKADSYLTNSQPNSLSRSWGHLAVIPRKSMGMLEILWYDTYINIKKEKKMSFYERLEQYFNAINEHPKGIEEGLQNNQEAFGFLSIVFNESSITQLAKKITIYLNYVANGGDKTYFIGTQPHTQKQYLDLDEFAQKKIDTHTRAKRNWKRVASKVSQSMVTFTLDRETAKEFLTFYRKIEISRTKIEKDGIDTLMKRLIKPTAKKHFSMNDFIDYNDIIRDYFYQLWTSGIDSQELLSRLSPRKKMLVAEVRRFVALLTHISKRVINGERAFTLTRREHHHLLAISYFWKDNTKLSATLEKAKQYQSFWPITAAGESKDQQYGIATIKSAIRLFPHDGKLHYFDRQTQTLKPKSTTNMRYKNEECEAALVITIDGQFYIFNHDYGRELDLKKFHSIVTQGEGVLFAGSILLINGEIKMLGEDSGHYKPVINMELLLYLDQCQLLHPTIGFYIHSKIRRSMESVLNKSATHTYLTSYLQREGLLGLTRIYRVLKTLIPSNLDAINYTKDIVKYTELLKHIQPLQISTQSIHMLAELNALQDDLFKEIPFESQVAIFNKLVYMAEKNKLTPEVFSKISDKWKRDILARVEKLSPPSETPLMVLMRNYKTYLKYYKACDIEFSSEEVKANIELILELINNADATDIAFSISLQTIIFKEIVTHNNLSYAEICYYIIVLHSKNWSIEELKENTKTLIDVAIRKLPYTQQLAIQALRLVGYNYYEIIRRNISTKASESLPPSQSSSAVSTQDNTPTSSVHYSSKAAS